MRGLQQACVDTQRALDRRARGALPSAEESSLLAEHLPGCAACRAFARTLEETETLMHARAQVLRREVDLTALTEAAHTAIRVQRRGMIRGLIGLAALIALCLTLYVATRNARILWPAAALLGVGAYAIMGDLTRFAMMHRWAEEAPTLDPAAARGARPRAILGLAGATAIALLPALLLETLGPVGDAITVVLELLGLVGVVHYAFVIRALNREVRALRD